MISYKTKTIANFMSFIELPINIVFYVPVMRLEDVFGTNIYKIFNTLPKFNLLNINFISLFRLHD